MLLPREEQIPNEPYRYKKNQTIKAIVKEVKRSGASGQPEIILSRASDEFLERLFEIEIPEIYDGIIQIKAIARDPGERSKVAVMSFDKRVDPVGACVGMKGIRIHSIVRELNNENIDLIEYSEDIKTFISRALLPSRVKDITVSPDIRSATVIVPDDQVSLAIGKNGQNVRLASKLTGYSLTLIKEGGEDIELSEFEDEFGEIYDKIIQAGVETAREFLDCNLQILLRIDGMTKDVLLDLRSIILTEFEEDELEDIEDKIDSALEQIDETTVGDYSPEPKIIDSQSADIIDVTDETEKDN
jgi:N utilization substance protein A